VVFAAGALSSTAAAPRGAHRSYLQRGVPARRTLPALPGTDLAYTGSLLRQMRTSPAPAGSQPRPRSKSAGRPAKEPAAGGGTSLPAAGLGAPVCASTPKSTCRQSAADGAATPLKAAVDHDAVRGERLSNYGQGTVLVGRRAAAAAASSRLTRGRRSVDAGVSRDAVSRDEDGLGELAAASGCVYSALPRRRCITPVNEATLRDTSSLFAAYQLRPVHQPAPALSDTESAPYLAGRRSLPRTGCVLPQGSQGVLSPGVFAQGGYPPSAAAAAFDSSPVVVPRTGAFWPATCGLSARPQSSAGSAAPGSGSADNIRKTSPDKYLVALVDRCCRLETEVSRL